MDYTTLTGSIGTAGSILYHANFARLDAAGILDEAQKWLYQKLRVAEMVTSEAVLISAEATATALPERYLDPIILQIPGYTRRLVYTDLERFKANLAYDSDGVLPEAMPTRWTREGGNMLFNHKADQIYTARLTFYQRPASLASDNETNWLTQKYPTLLRRACLRFAAEERKRTTEAQALELMCLSDIEDIKKESDLNMRGMSFDYGWNDEGED